MAETTEVNPISDKELGLLFMQIWEQANENHMRYSAQPSYEADIHFFALAMAGEAGETANLVKKRMRDGDNHIAEIREEIADTIVYGLMFARHMGMTPRSVMETIAHKQQVFLDKMAKRKPQCP